MTNAGRRVEFSAEPGNCNCPVSDGKIYHLRGSCTDPVAARLGWYADDTAVVLADASFAAYWDALPSTYCGSRDAEARAFAAGRHAERQHMIELAASAICLGADGQPCGAPVADILADLLKGDRQ